MLFIPLSPKNSLVSALICSFSHKSIYIIVCPITKEHIIEQVFDLFSIYNLHMFHNTFFLDTIRISFVHRFMQKKKKALFMGVII